MREHYGSVKEAFDKVLKAEGGYEASRGKLDFQAFKGMLSTGMGLQDGDSCVNSRAVSFKRMFDALDLYGWGYISLPEDLQFVEHLEFAPWVGKAPNPQAADFLRALLLQKYGNYISAWCQLLDKDNSNEVTWKEFQQSCNELGFTTDAPGCWRALDDDFSGVITLREIDEGSFQLLFGFKKWADESFGSVLSAFKALDTDRTGTMNCAEFKTASRFYGYNGNAKELFLALVRQPAQGRSLLLKPRDVSFLDQWLEQEIDDAGETLKPKQRTAWQTTRPLSAPLWRSPARRERCISPFGEAWIENSREIGWRRFEDLPVENMPEPSLAHSATCASLPSLLYKDAKLIKVYGRRPAKPMKKSRTFAVTH